MRLATIITPNGPRLRVKTDSGGYADIAEAAGEPGLAALTSFLAGGPAALEAARGLRGSEGRACGQRGFGRPSRARADPLPRRELHRARA